MTTKKRNEHSRLLSEQLGMPLSDFDNLHSLGRMYTVKALRRGYCTLLERNNSDTSHPLYRTWASMISRCTNSTHSNYKWYGAKRIRVCFRWLTSFGNFLADVGERPEGMTLDRIDPNKWYEPSNCRWADGNLQAANRVTKVGRAGLRGVTSLNDGYLAIMRRFGVDTYLGVYDKAEDAHLVYREHFINTFGFEPKYYGG